MSAEQSTTANCPKCRTGMTYVAAIPHKAGPHMRRTTFVCYSCNQTISYMLATAIAESYAAVATVV